MVAKLGRESGKGATIDAVVGGVLGPLGGPAGVLWLAVSGWVIGGIAGHFADRSIPKAGLEQIGAQIPPNGSAFLALVQHTDTEAVVNRMSSDQAKVVNVILGDELSGTIAQAVQADIAVPGAQTSQAATPQTSQETKDESKQPPQS